jgi:hypothetical protein
MTLEEYLSHLEEHNWHTLAALIRYERGQMESETELHDTLSVYLTAKNKRQALQHERQLTESLRAAGY